MKVFRRIAEEDGYLDHALLPGWVRVEVTEVVQYALHLPQFFVRSPNVRYLLAYLREIGLRDVLRKVRSRRAEKIRNERCMLLGVGRVLHSDEPRVQPGTIVPFIVPDSGPPSERYVIPAKLVGDPWPQDDSTVCIGPGWKVLRADEAVGYPSVARVAGWSPWSGRALDISRSDITDAVRMALRSGGERADCGDQRDPILEHTDVTPKSGLTVFGYGNYVKTMIIPELSRQVPVRCVHEIDPWQIGPHTGSDWNWDTSPFLRSGENPEIVVIASYHHMHAKIAAEAIERGARAVIVEKPIATNAEDLERLVRTLESSKCEIFAAFQRRYSPFNSHILADLDVNMGGPVSALINAYEVRLPPQHWYTWPNSGSSIISNGCHWIDHFLFLNNYSSVRCLAANRLAESTVVIRVELENNASLALTLTHDGSPRLGVREHCEFRTYSRTVTIDDSSRYVSESQDKVIRRMKVRRLEAHKRMYRTFGKHIVAGTGGDSLRSLMISTQTMLDAERALRSQRVNGKAS
jgi:predicted dehydrogenase